MEAYRELNQYKANPMSMRLNLCIYDESQGEFDGLIFMGEVGIKLNLKQSFSIAESCIIGGDMGMGLLKVEDNDESVWSIQYALVKGDGNIINFDTYSYDTVIDRIINKDEDLVIMNWMAGDIMATPMEGPGVYTLGAVAYDEDENMLSYATSTKTYMALRILMRLYSNISMNSRYTHTLTAVRRSIAISTICLQASSSRATPAAKSPSDANHPYISTKASPTT